MGEKEQKISLWEQWERGGDSASRDALIAHYLPWGVSVAFSLMKTFPPNLVPHDDIRQITSMALLESIARFCPDKGVPFEAFARKRVRGALLDEVTAENRQTLNTPNEEQGSRPFTALVDQLDGMVMEILLNSLGAEAAPIYPNFTCKSEMHTVLNDLVARLSRREQEVIKLAYFHDQSNREVARALRLSEGRVSQVKKMALDKLKYQLITEI
ncbi:sigma-70 family RNA polymerase sigma factor [Microbulbifer salipaludis]|uniref:Sigma-70 family RNA polymerase sigma factor n=1 Tax=Microbulbifer salipaludis TaxID=187980 RepID=A0ABS3EA20_9GAMM|nr:sigma-70 family RNA polymerase sigma factor [Microbulbifer salipaludis]